MRRERSETIPAGSPRRWLVAAAACLGLLALAPGQGPHIASVQGSVEIGMGEPPVWKAADSGDALAPGNAVRTGAGASAELALGTRTVRLYEHSVLRLPSDMAGPQGPAAVELEQGRSLFDVLRNGAGDRFQVRTREVVVSVKGTRFLVDASPAAAAAVAVFRGSVGVRALAELAGDEMTVRPGFSAAGGKGGAFELQLTPFEDPWESWTDGAPAPSREASAPRPVPAAAAALEGARDAAAKAAAAGMAKHDAMGIRPNPKADPVHRDGPVRKGGPGAPVAPPAALDPVTDVMRRELKRSGSDSTVGAVLDGTAGSPATGTAMPGGAPFSYEKVGNSLHVYDDRGLYTVIGAGQIQKFQDHSGPGGSDMMDLGAPINQIIQQHDIDPDDVEDVIDTLFK